jgi:septal ring factor EnvC (AmiA/AmiB activator)
LVAAEIRKANEEKARKEAELADNEAARNTKPSGANLNKPEPIASLGKTEKSSKPAKSSGTNMSVTAEDIALSGNFAGNRGKLPPPIDKGILISSFGEHAHAEFQNIKIKNNGIDITSSPGAKARSVFDGEVSSVMFITNLNYVVILRHGDYLTVYSNLLDVAVKKGDKISTREVLGTLHTATGESRSRLHFELWHGTSVLNPSDWIKM